MCIEKGVCFSSVKGDYLISISASDIRCNLQLMLDRREVELIS